MSFLQNDYMLMFYENLMYSLESNLCSHGCFCSVAMSFIQYICNVKEKMLKLHAYFTCLSFSSSSNLYISQFNIMHDW